MSLRFAGRQVGMDTGVRRVVRDTVSSVESEDALPVSSFDVLA